MSEKAAEFVWMRDAYDASPPDAPETEELGSKVEAAWESLTTEELSQVKAHYRSRANP